MYNRWIYSDELLHSGRLGQRWGVRNGPPYPLYRQERFKRVGPSGRPITSKVAYKKAVKVERAKKKAERSKHLNGTPEDHRERNSIVAKVKRAYRQYRNDQKETVERNKRAEKEWDDAVKRLENSGIPQVEADRLYNEANSKRWRDKSTSGANLNKAIDDYFQKQKDARDAAKEHGTAEEVMKYRDTYSEEEWNSIANRLNQEKRVRDMLPKDTQGGDNKQASPKFVPKKFSDSKTQQIYNHGSAREVFKNKDRFTPEELDSIAVRLAAEEKIATYADKQFKPKGSKTETLEKIVGILGTLAKGADSLSKINKALNGKNY